VINTIFIYAAFVKKGRFTIGGGEVGNARTINMLKDAGYRVIIIRHRGSKKEWGRFLKITSYPYRMFVGWIDVICTMLFASRKSIAHLSGYAGATIFNEYAIMHIMKFLGYQVIYELRGGGAIGFWKNGSASYKKMFSYLLNNACYVFVQGKENLPLIKSICTTPVYHYANYVEDGFAPETLPTKPSDRVNLLYHGRIERHKHVDMVVETAAFIQKEIPNVYLTIVGSGKPSYVAQIKDKMEQLLKVGSYSFLSGCKHKELPPLLRDKHFYIFPTTHPREGQSNSVTECMSYGIVPIASPQGFNSSTIGDDYLIVDELTAEAYAQRIIGIIKSELFPKYSQQVYNQFQNNYTQEIVSERTLAVYEKIINDML